MISQDSKIIISVQFSPWSNYSGGAQRSTHNIAMTLSRRGYDVSVIYSKPWFDQVKTPDDLPYQIVWATYPGFNTKGRSFFRNFSPISVYWQLRKILHAHDKVIYHSNSEEGACVFLLKKEFKFAFLATVRDSNFPPRISKTNKTIFDISIIAIHHLRYFLQGLTARSANLVTTPSEWASQFVADVYSLPIQKMHVVNNGVPSEFLNYSRDHDKAQDGPIVYFGRVAKEKGIETLLRAYANIQNISNELLIIGDGQDLDYFKKRALELNINQQCHFVGWKTHDELGELLTTAKMVCLPSLSENYSLAVLSSMCVGVPTIATRVGGNTEIIRSEEHGCIVAPQSESELENAILKYLDGDMNVAVGIKASQYVRSNINWEKAADQFLDLYELCQT